MMNELPHRCVLTRIIGIMEQRLRRDLAIEATGMWEYYTGPNDDTHVVPYDLSFTYNTTAAFTSRTSNQSVYPGLSFSLTVYLDEGTWSHSTNNVRITVNNSVYSDTFLIGTSGNPGAPAFLGASVDFYGFDLTASGTRYTDTSLPASITLTDYIFRKAKLYTGGYTGNQISQDSLTLGPASAIPEPSTWAAIAGVMALGVAAWRRRAGPSVTG
jgi:hypothetical protein